MEPGEALGIAAQIAVALAGFAGVVVVFRREAVHEWSGIDKLRLRLLLANSIVPLGLSMLGLLLITIKPRPPEIWRWCSVILLVATVSFVTATTKAFRRHPICISPVRSFRDGSDAPAIIQHRVARRVLAIFRGNRIPTRRRYGPICADDPFATRIRQHRLCPVKIYSVASVS